MQLTITKNRVDYEIITDRFVEHFESDALGFYEKLVKKETLPYMGLSELTSDTELEGSDTFNDYIYSFHFDKMYGEHVETHGERELTDDELEMIDELMFEDLYELESSLLMDIFKFWSSINLFYIAVDHNTFFSDASIQEFIPLFEPSNSPLREVW